MFYIHRCILQLMGHCKHREKPLVIYVFTESHQVFQEVLQGTSAGATVQNDTMIQNSCERAIATYIIAYADVCQFRVMFL